MVRYRAWMALGLLLGASGCVAPGRDAATRPYRPARAGLGGREGPGALTNQAPDGLARFFPGPDRAPAPAPSRPTPPMAGAAADPGPAPTLPVALEVEAATGPDAVMVAREPAGPKDESAR